MLPTPNALIFDLDGLVLDTESTFVPAWQLAAASMGFHLSHEFCQKLTGKAHDQVKALIDVYSGGNFNWQEFEQLSATHWRELVRSQGIQIKAGFHELLTEIQKRQLPFALATNSRYQFAVECLQAAGLETTFPIVLTRDQVTNAKPAPDLFLLTAEKLRVAIEDCWILEDSLTGIQAAEAAGAVPIYIPSTHPADSQAAKLSFRQFPNLSGVIDLLQLIKVS